MIHRLQLKAPGALAWKVTADGVIPVEFAGPVREGIIRDVQTEVDGRHTRRSVEVNTMVGPLYVEPGQWLILTDMEQVFGMPAESLDSVWSVVSVH